MAILRNGCENITVELRNWVGDNLAKQCWDFGQHGEFYMHNKPYDKDDPDCIAFINDIIEGRTFPKYALEATRLDFKVNNISRICLAQLTREKGIFCSESGGVRPLTNDIILPMTLYNDEHIRTRFEEIMQELEELYCYCAKSGKTYLDSRYIMPHGQTISIAYSATPREFVASCNSRTRNNLGDEINMVYKLALYEVISAVVNLTDANSKKLWTWLLKNHHSNAPYLRDCTYCNGFDEFVTPEGHIWEETAHENYLASSWKKELERLYETRPWLLTHTELDMLHRWKTVGPTASNYDKSFEKTFWKAVENMPYYKEDYDERK